MRTAKSCGPDASTLALSLRKSFPQATVTKKPDHRGELEVSCKTIARGMPGVSRCDLANACAFYHYHCTRGYRAHRTPGIPCALFLGRKINARLGHIAPRDRAVV